MKHQNPIQSLFLAAVLFAGIPAANAADVTVNPSAPWQGFMNVFDLPSAGGAYQFGNSWAPADLTATFSGPILTLGPNTIGDPAPYWYTPSGGPGATGNKIMDANFYVQNDIGTYANQTLTFSGLVLANTLTLNPNWTSVAFIKDFAPDYSSFNFITVPLTPGAFSISLPIGSDANRHIQYGFETKGPNVWITDVANYGTIQISAVPEPSSLAMLLCGAALLVPSVRRKLSIR